MKKTLFIFYILVISFSFSQETEANYKLIIFSGSDWCKPCIQLKKETLSNEELQQFLSDQLIETYIADFPRKKSNMPPQNTIKHNEELANTYNLEGLFPRLVLLDSDQNIIYTKNGFIEKEVLIQELKSSLPK